MFDPRIDVRDEFRADRAALLDLLRGLAPEQWGTVTAAAPWTVRDVVAHILGDDLNRLSRSRDHYPGDGPAVGETLPSFLHRINDEWVRATVRLGPTVLIELLEGTTARVLDLWAAVAIDALGDPVAWAGPDPAPVWLDCARDFTEYWVHAQQIREAAGFAYRPVGTHTVLDVFLRAMPHTLADVPRPDGTALVVEVAEDGTGDGGGTWTWRRTGGAWWPVSSDVDATVVRFPDPATLWRLCVRMLDPADAARRVVVTGDRELAERSLRIVSIIR